MPNKILYNHSCFGQAPRSSRELLGSAAAWLSVLLAMQARKQLAGTQSSKGGTPSEGGCNLIQGPKGQQQGWSDGDG